MKTFTDLMLEGRSIQAVLKKEFPEVRFNASENEEFIALSILVVQFKQRNQGIGSKFMKRFVDLADEHKKDIFLTPDASYAEDGEMSKSSLIKWYQKFGFVNKEKSDFRSQNTMCYYNKGR